MSSIPYHRLWMYDRNEVNRGGIKESFLLGVDSFIDFACKHPQFLREGTIRCPCVKCDSCKLLPPTVVKVHLYRKGFKPDYWFWTENGEPEPEVGGASGSGINIDGVGHQHTPTEQYFDQSNFHDMVYDACAAHAQENSEHEIDDDEPNEAAKNFFELLDSVNRPLWDGCLQSELSTAVRLLSIKSGGNISQRSMDEIISLMRDTNIKADHLPEDYYFAKKLVS